MNAAGAGTRPPEPGGLDPARAVQIRVTRDGGGQRLGSGYLVREGVVLTAAHVLKGAESVRVRFLTEEDRVRDVAGEPLWAHSESDIALLGVADGADGAGDGGPYAAGAAPVRFARVERAVDCEALGHPRFKLRRSPAPAVPDVTAYRDTHHVLGRAHPWSNRYGGTLELTSLVPPERDPDPRRSPWEGMSGAAVWSDGCLIGVVTEHHGREGLTTLAASPVSRWYERLSTEEAERLEELIGLPAGTGLLDRLPRPPAPRPAGSPDVEAAARKVADTVRRQWDNEERRRKVHDPCPLAVRFELTADGWLHDYWSNIRQASGTDAEQPLPLAGRLDQIVRRYRSIPSGRLVVLGAAGSGKTILTLRFVLDWLNAPARASASAPARVPVIFGLGSWNPESSLHDWMCDRLVRDYGLAAPDPDVPERNLSRALLDEGWILPVLDGFDEIAKGLRKAALEGLNQFKHPLLLTSRREEYAAALEEADVLSGAAVVELRDIALSHVKDYLRRASRPGRQGGLYSTVWEPVLERLPEERHEGKAAEEADSRGEAVNGAGTLAEVLTTPLTVAMARAIYSDAPGRDPGELLHFPDADALRKHLLAAFTPAAYTHPPTDRDSAAGRRRRRSWNPDRAQRWLGYLAAHLVGLDTSDLAWWRLGGTLRRSSRTLVIGALAALSFGVPTALGNVPVDLVATPSPLPFALVRGLVVGLLHGLVAGVSFGLLYAFVSRGAAEPSHVHMSLGREREDRGRFTPRFLLGLAVGVPAALALVLVDRCVVDEIGLADGLDGGLTGALLFVLETGFGIGLVLGVLARLEVPNDVRSAVSPADLLSDNRRNVVVQMLVWALVFGLAAGSVIGFKDGLVPGFADGPVRGLLAGLAFGGEAAFGGGFGYGLAFTAWGQWVALARMWLPLRGRLPWALVAFLDDACERGVLRQAGAVYQFRHIELRDHLARTYQERHGPPPEPHAPAPPVPAGAPHT